MVLIPHSRCLSFHRPPCPRDTIKFAVTYQRGQPMAGLTNALQELRAERTRTQSQVEKLDRAISLLVSLNRAGASSGTPHKGTHPVRVISLASRRKMAKAQRARWAKAKNGAQPVTVKPEEVAPAKPKYTMSAEARKKIAAAQRERWAKLKSAKKAA